MQSPGRFDAETPHNSERRQAALELVVRTTRSGAAGVVHDLNSALQCIGDALFAIREDVYAAVDGDQRAAASYGSDLATSFRLADDACDRIRLATEALTALVPAVVPTGSVCLGSELQSLVTATSPWWRNRFDVVLDVEPGIPPVDGEWWIVRAAIMDALHGLLTTRAGHEALSRPTQLPSITISARQRDGVVCVRLRRDGWAGAIDPEFHFLAQPDAAREPSAP